MLNPTKTDITHITREDLEEAYEDLWSLLEEVDNALETNDWNYITAVQDKVMAVVR